MFASALTRSLFVTCAVALLSACQPASRAAAPSVPEGYARADYIPDWPAPNLPRGLTRDDILVRHGCYYILQDGRPVFLPFTETNRGTGRVTNLDRYCIG